MPRKVCTVTGLDARGLPHAVQVEAGSLFEAAAAGLEALHQQKCLVSAIQITVHEPGKQYRVHPRQLERWLRSHDREDSIGVHALKRRVREILQNNPIR